MKTLELTYAQILEAIREYAERRGMPLKSVLIVCRSGDATVPNVKEITAHGIVKTTEKS